MKIDRCDGNCGERQITAVSAYLSSAQGPSSSFATTLRQYRQRETRQREAPRQSDATARPAMCRSNVHTDAKRWIDDSLRASVLAEPTIEPQRMRAFVSITNDSWAPAPAGIGASRDIRRRSAAVCIDATPCIEIVHSSTGMRFLLSRQNGVWLLSVQSQQCTRGAAVQPLLEALRSQFAARGLGPIDIVM